LSGVEGGVGARTSEVENLERSLRLFLNGHVGGHALAPPAPYENSPEARHRLAGTRQTLTVCVGKFHSVGKRRPEVVAESSRAGVFRHAGEFEDWVAEAAVLPVDEGECLVGLEVVRQIRVTVPIQAFAARNAWAFDV
jgi:hypothetical protein